jgi:predicted enzyme related to lactoylglutathione lyase
MSRVVHFEITADDPRRAIDFYRDIFGWKISKWEGPEEYWVIETGNGEEPGINGGMMKRKDDYNGMYNTIQVKSVDEYLEKVTAGGGEVVVPKMAIRGVGYLAYCKDTEKNIFGIMHPDQDAK